jgi:hypothetical protein
LDGTQSGDNQAFSEGNLILHDSFSVCLVFVGKMLLFVNAETIKKIQNKNLDANLSWSAFALFYFWGIIF